MKNARSVSESLILNKNDGSGISSIQRSLRQTACTSILLLCAGCSSLMPISVSHTGEWADDDTREVDVSADGRFVMFTLNNDTGCANGLGNDVFRRDTFTGSVIVQVIWLFHDCSPVHSPSITTENVGVNDSVVALVGGHAVGRYYNSAYERVYVMENLYTNPLGTLSEHCVPNVNIGNPSLGVRANGPCTEPDISADGTKVVYSSTASNLLISNGNSNSDVYITDAIHAGLGASNLDVLVSQAVTGVASNGDSHSPSVSRNGRYIAFASTASNLVTNDTNGAQDIFVRDRKSNSTARISNSFSPSQQANGDSSEPVISPNGRYVAYTTTANNVRPEDTLSDLDVYVHDSWLDTTQLVSVDLPGPAVMNAASGASISNDGRFIAFDSNGPLVIDDTNSVQDVYVRDMEKGITKRVSEGATGQQGSAASYSGAISADGRYVAFLTEAGDLHSDDNNGFTDAYLKAAIEPTVDSITPDILYVGTTSVTISGSYFMPGSIPAMNSANFSNIVIVDENTITADIHVSGEGRFSTHDVWVHLPASGPSDGNGLSSGECTDCAHFY